MPPRNQHFHTPGREPFENDDRLTLQRAEGPFTFLNPTRAHFNHSGLATSSKSTSDDTATSHDSIDENGSNPKNNQFPDSESNVPAQDVRFLWRSRDNRKGRHPLLVQKAKAGEEAPFLAPRRSSHPQEILKVVIKTFTYYPIWDISWLVAFIFTWGSVVWVMNVGFHRRDLNIANGVNRVSSSGYPSSLRPPSSARRSTMPVASPHLLAR